MSRKLLDKTTRAYVIFSLLVLAITGPAFYFFSRSIQEEEADEALLLRKHEFEIRIKNGFSVSDIDDWNKWNRDILIEPDSPLSKDPLLTDGAFPNVMDGDEEPYRVLRSKVSINGKDFVFFSRVNMLESEELLISIFMLYAVLLVLLLSGLFVMSRWLSKRLWKPFYAQLSQLEAFEVHNPSEILSPETDVEEFRRLNHAVERLFLRNITIFRSHKEFVENAAHELQTPLAVMLAKLDNLLQEESMSGSKADALDHLYQSVKRLSRLNRNLLMLSRIQPGFFPESEALGVNQLLDRQLDFLADHAREKQVTVETSWGPEWQVKANEILLETLLGNLLANAIRHNVPGGSVRVKSGNGSLEISNTGSGESLNPEIIFKRFGKGDPSGEGTGLGLSISKEIAQLYKWILTYRYSEGLHYFTLTT